VQAPIFYYYGDQARIKGVLENDDSTIGDGTGPIAGGGAPAADQPDLTDTQSLHDPAGTAPCTSPGSSSCTAASCSSAQGASEEPATSFPTGTFTAAASQFTGSQVTSETFNPDPGQPPSDPPPTPPGVSGTNGYL